jgi:hypothetical protein
MFLTQIQEMPQHQSRLNIPNFFIDTYPRKKILFYPVFTIIFFYVPQLGVVIAPYAERSCPSLG